jgi:hypothetical protein
MRSDSEVKAKPFQVIVTIINLFGSLASLTGVTLLWARDSIDAGMLARAVGPVSITILLGLALFILVATLWYAGFDILRDQIPHAWPVYAFYMTLAGAGAIWLLGRGFRFIYQLTDVAAVFKA